MIEVGSRHPTGKRLDPDLMARAQRSWSRYRKVSGRLARPFLARYTRVRKIQPKVRKFQTKA